MPSIGDFIESPSLLHVGGIIRVGVMVKVGMGVGRIVLVGLMDGVRASVLENVTAGFIAGAGTVGVANADGPGGIVRF